MKSVVIGMRHKTEEFLIITDSLVSHANVIPLIKIHISFKKNQSSQELCPNLMTICPLGVSFGRFLKKRVGSRNQRY